MKNNYALAVLLSCVTVCTAGCSINDVYTEKPVPETTTSAQIVASDSPSASDQPTNTAPTKPAKVYPMIARPKIGEEFPVPSLVKSGTILATVNGAKVYTNLYEAGIKWEDMLSDFKRDTDGDISNGEEYFFNRKTGDFLQAPGWGKTAFVVVELTLENVGAVSSATALNFPQDHKYDDDVFRIDTFDICPIREENADDSDNVFNRMRLQWCSQINQYPNVHPFAVRLPEGEKVTLKIGTVIEQTVYDNAIKNMYGGKLGDDLVSRLYLATSNSPRDPMVHLELEAIE